MFKGAGRGEGAACAEGVFFFLALFRFYLAIKSDNFAMMFIVRSLSVQAEQKEIERERERERDGELHI